VLKEEYNYPASQIEPIAAQVVRALELKKDQEPATAALPPKPAPKPETLDAASEPLTQADPHPHGPAAASPLTEIALPEALAIAGDIGWLPGRFSTSSESADRMAACRDRLIKDYRYAEEEARKVAELAEAAWQHMHPAEAEKPPSSEPALTTVYVPEEHPSMQPAHDPGQPPTPHGSTPFEKTFPSLSSEEAFHVFSVLTEKYGYSSRSARGIAERASSANRRWQSAKDEAQAVASAGKGKPHLPATIVTEPPSEAAFSPGEQVGKPQAPPESTDGPYIIVPSPECEFPLKFDSANAALLGRKARCPKCQTKFRLPESV
jgi:hypothetical protein